MPPEKVIFDRKEFLDFLEWAGIAGEIHTTEGGKESFILNGCMGKGNVFSVESEVEPQQSAPIFEMPPRSREEEIADLETAIPELKTQLKNMEQRLVSLKRERNP